MSNSIAQKIIYQQGNLRSLRSNYEHMWYEVAREMLPNQNIFFGNNISKDTRMYNRIYDSTGIIALSRASSAFDSLNTPKGQYWHDLSINNKNIEDNVVVKRWLEEIRDILFRYRYSDISNFGSAAYEKYQSLLAFGTAVFYEEYDPENNSIIYDHIHLSEMFLSENAKGVIDSVYRKFQLTARQAQEMEENNGWILPVGIKNALEREPERKFEFIHHVSPNTLRKKVKKDSMNMKYKSYYVSIEGNMVVSESGYNTFPYQCTRIMPSPNQIYGDSPGMQVIGDVKYLQESDKVALEYAQRNASPTYLSTSQFQVRRAQLIPNNIVPGGLDYTQGGRQIEPLLPGNDPRQNELNIQRKKDNINDAFMISLFQLLANNTSNTATEVLQKAQEQGLFLGSMASRLQSEWFSPMISREIDLLSSNGLLPPMPDELIENSENGIDIELDIDFTSPMSKILDATKAMGTMRTLEAIGQISALYPDIINSINSDEIVEVLANANGMPAKLLRTKDEIEELNAQMQQQQQQQELLQAAPMVSSVAKDINNMQ